MHASWPGYAAQSKFVFIGDLMQSLSTHDLPPPRLYSTDKTPSEKTDPPSKEQLSLTSQTLSTPASRSTASLSSATVSMTLAHLATTTPGELTAVPTVVPDIPTDLPLHRGAWIFFNGECRNKRVRDAGIRVINQGKDIREMAVVFKNAYNYGYQDAFNNCIREDCQAFLQDPDFSKKIDGLKRILAEERVTLSTVWEDDRCRFIMKDCPLSVDETSSQEIAAGLPFMPMAVLSGILDQYFAPEPLEFTAENSERFREIFSAPGNQKYKRAIFKQAIATPGGLRYLNRVFEGMPPGSKADLSGVNLSKLNLVIKESGGLLTPSREEHMNFSGVNFTGANLRGAKLLYAILDGANLTDASMHDTDLQYASVKRVRLQGELLTNANLMHTDLWGAFMTGTFVGTHIANFQGVNLIDANLEQIVITITTDTEISFKGARLQSTKLPPVFQKGMGLLDFTETWLSNMDLSGIAACNLNFRGAKLFNVVLRNMRSDRIDMHAARLRRVDVAGTNFVGTDFRLTRFDQVNLLRAKLVKITINAETLAHLPGMKNWLLRYYLINASGFKPSPRSSERDLL